MFYKGFTLSASLTDTATQAVSKSAKDMGVADAAVTAVFGYVVVFLGLVILMTLLYIIGAYFKSKDEKAKAAKDAEVDSAAKSPNKAASASEKPVAPGSAGHVKLFDVPDKEAAMIMAIVADKMQKPLNELHFISIKEVK